ncbi:hypothetical protein HDU93_008244 [Gonapodya sp. JEL0774]|nr:hypothetical protein HDU93_008244 [Gonapodya sp. JEL0774]
MTCQTDPDTEPVSSPKVDPVVPDDLPPLPCLPVANGVPPPKRAQHKVRQVFWKALRDPASTIWAKWNREARLSGQKPPRADKGPRSSSSNNVALEDLLVLGGVYNEVDSVFEVKAPAAQGGKAIHSGPSGAQGQPALKVLDDREYQQLAIMLRKIRGVQEHAIVSGFLTLHKEVLEAPFVSFVAAKMLKGTYDAVISNAERFRDFREYEKVVFKIASVPQIKERLQIWTAMHPLSDDLSKLEQNGRTLATALESVFASESLATVFKAILLVGNHMNGRNAKAAAAGLELSSIVAVSQDTKSSDGKTTLLDFVAGVLEHHVPSATVGIFAELESVSAAGEISLDELTKSLSDTEKLIKSSQQLLDSAMSKPSGEGDTFFSHAKGAFQSAKARCRGIKELLKRTSVAYQTAASAFGAESGDMSAEKLLGEFARFLRAFKDALKATQERRAKEKEADRMRNATPRKLKSAANAADGELRKRPHPPTTSTPSAIDGSRCLPTPPSGSELAVGSSWSLCLSAGREGEEVGRVLGKSSLNDSTMTVAANDILCVDGSA